MLLVVTRKRWPSAVTSYSIVEPRQPVRIECERGRQDLERDVAIQPGITTAIHLSHPARAKDGDDLEWAKAGAGCQGHRRIIPADRHYNSRDPSAPQALFPR